MADSRHEFVADELWLLVAVLTVPFAALAEAAGLPGLGEAVGVVGFLMLTPLLLFWGEEVADLLFDPPDAADDGQATDEGADGEADSDPLAELKEQYALGHVDEREFEERLERLLALDEVDASDADVAVLRGESPGASSGASPVEEEPAPDLDVDLEREQ